MRPFTDGELTRIKGVHVGTMGKQTAVGFTAAVARIPDSATAASDRETVVTALKCRNIRPMNGRQKELAGFASTERIHRCKCEVNTSVIPDYRLILASGVDYRIRDVVPVPENAPHSYLLYLAEEG